MTILEIERPEGMRKFHVYVPSVYNNTFAVPLHLSFHGLNDNCEHFMKAVGFMEFAEKYNFILITPCGHMGDMGIAWNAGRCCGFPPHSIVLLLSFIFCIFFFFCKLRICVICGDACVKKNINLKKVDDIAFTVDIIGNISQKLCINPNQIFVSGFSNGAMMAEVLRFVINAFIVSLFFWDKSTKKEQSI